MGPLQCSIRSATFWPATRIPATQQGPAAERLAKLPVPSVATSSHGHMRGIILWWSPRNASPTVLVHETEELRALGSLRCPQHKQCHMSHSSSNTLHSSLRHNQVPPFSPAPHRPAWESSHCFSPQEGKRRSNCQFPVLFSWLGFPGSRNRLLLLLQVAVRELCAGIGSLWPQKEQPLCKQQQLCSHFKCLRLSPGLQQLFSYFTPSAYQQVHCCWGESLMCTPKCSTTSYTGRWKHIASSMSRSCLLGFSINSLQHYLQPY